MYSLMVHFQILSDYRICIESESRVWVVISSNPRLRDRSRVIANSVMPEFFLLKQRKFQTQLQVQKSQKVH